MALISNQLPCKTTQGSAVSSDRAGFYCQSGCFRAIHPAIYGCTSWNIFVFPHQFLYQCNTLQAQNTRLFFRRPGWRAVAPFLRRCEQTECSRESPHSPYAYPTMVNRCAVGFAVPGMAGFAVTVTDKAWMEIGTYCLSASLDTGKRPGPPEWKAQGSPEGYERRYTCSAVAGCRTQRFSGIGILQQRKAVRQARRPCCKKSTLRPGPLRPSRG